MKQRTYNVTTEEELSAALSEIAASSEYRGASAVLLHVLTDLLSRDEAADILGKAKAALPRAKTVGASVVEFRGPDEGTRHVRLSACFFERSDVEVHEYGPEEDLAALGARIAKELSARPDIRGVEVYHGGSTVGIEDFLAAASMRTCRFSAWKCRRRISRNMTGAPAGTFSRKWRKAPSASFSSSATPCGR